MVTANRDTNINEDKSYYDGYNVQRYNSDGDDDVQTAPISENILRFDNMDYDKIFGSYLALSLSEDLNRIIEELPKRHNIKLNHKIDKVNKSRITKDLINSLMLSLKDFLILLDEDTYRTKYSSKNSV